MKKILKFYLYKLELFKRRVSVNLSFKKRHRNIYNNGQYKRSPLTKEEKKIYLKYWKKVGSPINLSTVEIVKSLSGKFDKRIVPEEVFALLIEPMLNMRPEIAFLENKNIYTKWFGDDIFPKVYLNKVGGRYYDAKLSVIKDVDDYFKNLTMTFPIVFKPSLDTYGGANVFFLNSKEEIRVKLNDFENIVVQEKISQSGTINSIYSENICTVRVCLYRRSLNSNIVVLNTSLRMGKDGTLDNETAGGIVNNIDKNGLFNNYAVDKTGKKYFQHPNSKTLFKGKILPNYRELIEVSVKIADKILLANLMSIDMVLDNQEKWKCIEVNLRGQTIRFAQYAGTPFFGEFTDEIIESLKV